MHTHIHLYFNSIHTPHTHTHTKNNEAKNSEKIIQKYTTHIQVEYICKKAYVIHIHNQLVFERKRDRTMEKKR